MKKTISLILLLSLSPLYCFAIASWVEKTTNSSTGVSSVTFTHTMTLGTNNALLLACGRDSGTEFTSATDNGVTMTRHFLQGWGALDFWILATSTVTNSIKVSWDANDRYACAANTLAGINQATPLDTSGSDGGANPVTTDVKLLSTIIATDLMYSFNYTAGIASGFASYGLATQRGTYTTGAFATELATTTQYQTGMNWTTGTWSGLGVIGVQAAAAVIAPPIVPNQTMFFGE